MLDHRGEVDSLHEVVPVDDDRIECEQGAVGFVERVGQRHQPVDPVDGLGLGVRAVQLDVAAGTVDLGPAVGQGGGECGLPTANRQRGGDLLGCVDDLGRSLQLARHPATAGERPLGYDDGRAVGVEDGVAREVVVDQIDEMAVPKGLPRAGRDLVHARRGGRAVGGDGDDRRHHEVDGDHVDHTLGDARELLQHASGIGDDHRLGHAEPADPPGHRFGERGLDDRRAHDRDWHVAPVLQERAFAERLCVGVGVGPAK